MRKLTTFLVAAGLLAAVPLAAQTVTGTVEGVVKDEQGGVLPGVTVTLTGKRGALTAVSSASGEYRFAGIDPGVYSVDASLPGFRPKRREGVSVSIGKIMRIDFALAVGGVSETLDVTADSPMIDATSSGTDNTLSQDLLFNLPIRPSNAAADTMNFLPGINNRSAFGANGGNANALLIDGVDTRDPTSGTTWVFYNFDLMEEVQVSGLGAPAEYGGFTGAVVNTVTKSGGNTYAGLFDFYWTKDALQGNNITNEIATKNPSLKTPAEDRNRLDLTGQLGGPLIKDKLFFYGSAQRYLLDTNPSGPIENYKEVSPRLNLKLTYQPNTSNTLQAMFQYDNYNINGRSALGAFVSTDDLTVKEDAPGWLWAAQWRHLFGAKTFSEVKYTGWWGYYDLIPAVTDKPMHYNAATGGYSGSAGTFDQHERSRNQVNASLSHYAEGFGKHDLKFGLEIERSRVKDKQAYLFGLYYYDDTRRAPVGKYSVYDYSYDQDGINQRASFFAQDAWHPSDRLTVNGGVRLDLVKGKDPINDKTVYDNANWNPRIGFAYDLTGDNKTVLKAHYGQYYEAMYFDVFWAALPGIKDFVGYEYDPKGSKCGPLGNCFTEFTRTLYSILYTIDPNMKHPRVDEWTGGLERALGKDLRVGVTGIWREDKNVQSSVFPDARWTPVTRVNPLGGTLAVYNWANRSASERNHWLMNVDGFQYRDPSGAVLGTAVAQRKYKGLMLVLDKRFSNRWQGRVSYVLSKSEGSVQNSGSSTTSPSVAFDTPSIALVNNYGAMLNDRTHELKILGRYQVPRIEVGVNAYWRTLSGRNYTPYQRFSSSQVNYPRSSGREIWLEPRGSRRLGTENYLDLRLDREIGLGGKNRLGLYLDLQNLFNASTVTSVITRYPSSSISGVGSVAFESPAEVYQPFKAILGARWSF